MKITVQDMQEATNPINGTTVTSPATLVQLLEKLQQDFGVGDFDQFLFELYLNQQQQPPPTATVCTDDGLGNQSCPPG